MRTTMTMTIMLAFAGSAFLGTPQVMAAPVNSAGIAHSLKAETPVHEARLYCHRGSVFLHWGPCRRDAYAYGYRPYYRRHYYRRYYY
jgi:hypothetical protein